MTRLMNFEPVYSTAINWNFIMVNWWVDLKNIPWNEIWTHTHASWTTRQRANQWRHLDRGDCGQKHKRNVFEYISLSTNSTSNTHDIKIKQEAHLHNNKDNKRLCEGHKKFCEHETLYRCLRPQIVASGGSPSLRTLLILSVLVCSQNFYIC